MTRADELPSPAIDPGPPAEMIHAPAAAPPLQGHGVQIELAPGGPPPPPPGDLTVFGLPLEMALVLALSAGTLAVMLVLQRRRG